MKRTLQLIVLLLIVSKAFAQVHTTYLWHMQQPIYWPDKSKANTNRYQVVKESHDLKLSGENVYSDGIAHPTNNLEEIFSKADRVNAYTHTPKNSVSSISHHPDAGAQVNYSGCLIENVNSLAGNNQWGYYPGWENNFTEAKNWKTTGGNPRMDMIGFTFHHALSPLISERALAKEIQAHKYISTGTFGGPYSKGYWPAECSFSERIIKVLVQEGIEWSVIANSHLSRTLSDYDDHNYGTSGVNIDPPNRADKVATAGVNWWGGQIDGRGGTFAAPYCYQAHKAKYVDPETGQEYKIDVVPMGDLLSYQDGFSQLGTGDIDAFIAPFADPNHPSLVLLAHDGDNAWGGGSSYYNEAVKNFTNAAAAKGYHPTTIQQFLDSNPVPADDIVRVEDGSWVNAANDWGHPQFINWLWPLYETENYRFNPDGWTEDARNWAVITAAENYVIMAEDLAGNVDIADVVSPNGNTSNAEKAWHFFLPSLTSGYMYYGKAEDMEVKQTIAGNNAIEFAQAEINNHPNQDNTAPSVFIPQRFPYNPGGKGFGPIYGYQEFQNSSNFHVWTFAYDVSGLQSVVLKYRTDNDGTNPLTDNENDIYAGGEGVSDWISLDMTRKAFPKENITNDPEINFFELPTAIADLCYAEITGLSETLVDYYVEATDSKGNVFKTPIQHVYVGQKSADQVTVDIQPEGGTYTDSIAVSMSGTSTAVGATVKIYYTTNGSEPDSTDTLFESDFYVGGDGNSVTVKAIAYDSEGNKSPIISRYYNFGQVNPFDVHFKNTGNWSNVKIYLFDWNTKEALPNWNWSGVNMEQEDGTSWYKFTISEAVQVGIVFNDGGSQKTVDLTRTTEGWYDFSTQQWYDQCPGDCPGPQVPELTVSPAPGTYPISVTVELTATNNGAITYTLDGSDPVNGTPYTNPIEITSTTRLRAIASNDVGFSDEFDGHYTITCPVPVLSVNPLGQDFEGSINVSLTATNNGSIKYTLDGSNPASGFDYVNELTFTETTRLRAIATNQCGSSNEIDETYNLVISQCDTIYFYNRDNWANVKIYLFSADGSGLPGWLWPGVDMVQIDNSKWFYYVNCEEGDVGIVFNNGAGTQLSDEFSNNGWFYQDNTWSENCPGNCPGETVQMTLYYNNNNTNWASVNLYYWNTTPASLSTTWPGVQMTDPDGDGWYEYTLDGVECANVIFSNNGASQTGDEYACGDSYWDNGWVSNPGLKAATGFENYGVEEIISGIPYPNPFKRKLRLKVSKRSDLTIDVLDMQGRIVFSKQLCDKQGELEIDLNIPRGVYLLKVSTSKTANSFRIIKE